jgi:hypothetical protein
MPSRSRERSLVPLTGLAIMVVAGAYRPAPAGVHDPEHASSVRTVQVA